MPSEALEKEAKQAWFDEVERVKEQVFASLYDGAWRDTFEREVDFLATTVAAMTVVLEVMGMTGIVHQTVNGLDPLNRAYEERDDRLTWEQFLGRNS